MSKRLKSFHCKNHRNPLTDAASESELISVETSVSESQTESESWRQGESEKVEEVVSESITKRESI